MTINRDEPKTAMAMRIPQDLHERVKKEADARGLSLTMFMVALIEHGLDDLGPAIPVDIFRKETTTTVNTKGAK